MGCCPSGLYNVPVNTLYPTSASLGRRDRYENKDTEARPLVKSRSKRDTSPSKSRPRSRERDSPKPEKVVHEEIKALASEIIVFPIHREYGSQSFWFPRLDFLKHEKLYDGAKYVELIVAESRRGKILTAKRLEELEREAGPSIDLLNRVQSYIERKHGQALSETDIIQFQKWGCLPTMVDMILASQLRHLILWESALLHYFYVETDTSKARLAQVVADEAGRTVPSLHTDQAQLARDPQFKHELAYLGPSADLIAPTRVVLPKWAIVQYEQVSQTCSGVYPDVALPVLRGSRGAFRDVYQRD